MVYDLPLSYHGLFKTKRALTDLSLKQSIYTLFKYGGTVLSASVHR